VTQSKNSWAATAFLAMHHHGFLFQWQCAVFKKSDKSDNNQLGLCNIFQGRTKIAINLCDDGMLQLPQFVSGAMHCCMWVSFFLTHWVISFFWMTTILPKKILIKLFFDGIVHLWHQHAVCNLFPVGGGLIFIF